MTTKTDVSISSEQEALAILHDGADQMEEFSKALTRAVSLRLVWVATAVAVLFLPVSGWIAYQVAQVRADTSERVIALEKENGYLRGQNATMTDLVAYQRTQLAVLREQLRDAGIEPKKVDDPSTPQDESDPGTTSDEPADTPAPSNTSDSSRTVNKTTEPAPARTPVTAPRPVEPATPPRPTSPAPPAPTAPVPTAPPNPADVLDPVLDPLKPVLEPLVTPLVKPSAVPEILPDLVPDLLH